MSPLSYEPLDAALDQLSGCGPGLANGNFSHAPMVAEALCALGRPEAVQPWVERYRDRTAARAPVGLSAASDGDPIHRAEWRHALGRRDRFAGWSALFAGDLRDRAWQEVLALWAARLAPGVSAAATHGAIRVGHAVRSLTVGESPQRLRELADALASWASAYSELPTVGDPGDGGLAPREAIARISIIPPARRRPGNITAALAGLGDVPDFAPVIGLVDLGGELGPLLAELNELFARVYLANVSDTRTAIAFIHGVTCLTALGHIAPHVGDATARSLLRYGWQAGCGLYACFGSGAGFARDDAAGDEDDVALIDRAVASGDEHVIKFTEACLWRHRVAPSPAYPAAIANVLDMVPRR